MCIRLLGNHGIILWVILDSKQIPEIHYQQEKPENFVIATGETASVRDFVRVAFATLNLNFGDFVVQNPKYLRPNEVNFLKGDASKAKQILNWSSKTNWKKLAERMVLEDLEIINSKSKSKNDEYWNLMPFSPPQ